MPRSKQATRGFALEAAQLAFITGPVSISVGSCNAAMVPSLARGLGCRYDRRQQTITVFVATARAPSVLRDLRAGGGLAVVCSRPTTHQTLQIKGRNAVVTALAEGDRECMLAYAEAFTGELCSLGHSAHFAAGVVQGAADDAVAVSFMPLKLFEQTPGPGAGKALGGS